ncbi:MAG: ACT domain-containing protein [Candidatus Nanopelagicales bacterium]
MALTIRKLHGDYWIAQVASLEQALIDQIREQSPDFWTLTQTQQEISVVSNLSNHQAFIAVEGPWSVFGIVGRLDFSLTGILSRCSAILADANISIFAISTYDTDYFLVRKETTEAAISAWRDDGISIE